MRRRVLLGRDRSRGWLAVLLLAGSAWSMPGCSLPPAAPRDERVALAAQGLYAADEEGQEAALKNLSFLAWHGVDVLPEVRRALAAPRPLTRRLALALFWGLGPAARELLPEVRAALGDEVPEVRAGAALALGIIEPRASSVPVLLPLLADQDDRVRGCAAVSLGRIGPPAAPASAALLELLAANDFTLRRRAAGALRRIQGRPAQEIAAFLAVLERDPEFSPAVAALLHYGARAAPAAGRLGELLSSSPSGEVRLYSAMALGGLGPEAAPAAPALIAALDDEDDMVREYAVSALGLVGAAAAGALPGLLRLVTSWNSYEASGASLALCRMGPAAAAALPALRAAARGASPDPAGMAAVACWRISGDRAEVERLLASSEEARREGVIRALGQSWTDGRRSLPELARALAADEAAGVREAAAGALDRLGPVSRAALPELIGALGDASPEVRFAAAQALGRLGPAAAPAVPALAEILRGRADRSLKAAVIATLEKLGPDARPAEPVLEKMLADEDLFFLVRPALWRIQGLLPQSEY